MKTIELADVFNPHGIVGGRGVTVTNDGNGNVTISAGNEPIGLRTDADRWREQNHIKAYADHHSTADLDMRDRFGVIRDSGPSGSVADNCDQPVFIAGEDINRGDVPCFVYKAADGLTYKVPRKS